MPNFMGEMGVSCDDVDLRVCFFKFGIILRSVFNFRGAVEGKSGGHKDEYVPLAFEARIGDLDKLAVVKGGNFE